MMADLSYCNPMGADLSGANLSGCGMRRVNLTGATLLDSILLERAGGGFRPRMADQPAIRPPERHGPPPPHG